MTEPTSLPSCSGCEYTLQITEKRALVLNGINIILAGKISTHSDLGQSDARQKSLRVCAGDMLAVLVWHYHTSN